ncbi:MULTISPECIES: hypothetical protein [unclassified Microcoleus]|uniref:hypothetical protein n=1 Tax=unclassified Microcoleus TaxID=2642155 RepID=UPI002FCFEF56
MEVAIRRWNNLVDYFSSSDVIGDVGGLLLSHFEMPLSSDSDRLNDSESVPFAGEHFSEF